MGAADRRRLDRDSGAGHRQRDHTACRPQRAVRAAARRRGGRRARGARRRHLVALEGLHGGAGLMTSYMANERSAATGFAPVAGRLEGVRKHYGRNGAPDVLHGVSAVFPHGTMTAVMGLSGSGKSTLLHLASGLDQPNAGRIWLGGVEITKMSRRRLATLRRRKVGFVFQDLNLVP